MGFFFPAHAACFSNGGSCVFGGCACPAGRAGVDCEILFSAVDFSEGGSEGGSSSSLQFSFVLYLGVLLLALLY